MAKYRSQREAVLKTGISQGNMSECLNGKRKHCEGFTFMYEDTHNSLEVIGNIYEHSHLLDNN